MVSPIFKTTGPLDFEQDRAVYVERPEFSEILRKVHQPHIDSYLAVLGSRQTGKTTLLYRLYGELKRAEEAVAFLDLSAYCKENAAQSYAHAALKIWEEMQEQLAAPGKLRAVARAVDGPIRFREFLLDLARQCQSVRIVILLDEIGSFMSNMGFFETIRNISSSRGHDSEQAFQKYLFVFSGAVDLHDLTTSQNSPLANICQTIDLQDFELEGTELLVSNLRQVAPLEAGVAACVHEQAHGHPYLTQQICSLIERSKPAQITIQAVEQAIEHMLEGDENLRYVTMQLDRFPEANEVLRKVILDDMTWPFSMLSPPIARLFVIGAIRRETMAEVVDGVLHERSRCAVRNLIYKRSLRSYYQAVLISSPAEEGSHHPPDGGMQLSPAVGPRDYLDFSMHIYPSPTRGEPFPVMVESWAGMGNGQVLLDVRSQTLKVLVERLEQSCPAPDDLHVLGVMLWQALFVSPEVERRYVACQAEAGTQKGIRLKLNIESPDLTNLPWEYLYDPESQTFPALSPRTPITRYTNPRQQEPPPLAFEPPLRILLVSAMPSSQPQLDVEFEREQIVQAMERLQRAGKVQIEVLEHATVRSLQTMLRRPFHVLHYIGHGTYDEQTGNGMLALEDERGNQHAVSASQLQYLLRDTTVRLAVFNACMTARGAAGRSIAGELMRAGLSAALAMQFAISEGSATVFAGEFYRTLADGWPVDAAVAEGRKAVMFATDLSAMDWGIPVLFMRTRDGILFQREK